MTWTERNLAVQGCCLRNDESRSLRWGLPFPAGLCFVLVALGTVWLLAVGLLFAFGQPTAAPILGVLLLPACGLVTLTNFCIPSTLLGIWWRRRGTAVPIQVRETT